jgi:hypothetical protein
VRGGAGGWRGELGRQTEDDTSHIVGLPFSSHFISILFFSFLSFFFSKNHNHKLLKQQQYISQESQSHSTTFQHNNHRNTRITNAFYKHHTKSHKDTQGATTHYGSSTSNTEPAAPAPREDLCRRPRRTIVLPAPVGKEDRAPAPTLAAAHMRPQPGRHTQESPALGWAAPTFGQAATLKK